MIVRQWQSLTVVMMTPDVLVVEVPFTAVNVAPLPFTGTITNATPLAKVPGRRRVKFTPWKEMVVPFATPETICTGMVMYQNEFPPIETVPAKLADTSFERVPICLSEQEKAFVERADPGFGIMVTEQGRVPFYNQLTPMEHAYFTTKPEEAKSRGTPGEAKPPNPERVPVPNEVVRS